MTKQFEQFGCVWKVVKRYELSDEYMKENNLFHKNRVTIECVKGNGFILPGEVRDFANTNNL